MHALLLQKRVVLFKLTWPQQFEYDADTLKEEYIRDSAKGTPTGEPIHIPHGYFPQDNPDLVPEHSWKTVGQVFYSNWVHSLIQRRWQRDRPDRD